MGYRDDFYAVENIIGYTGVLHDFPTVYFQTGTEYGHITQRHDFSQNVGRNEIHSAVGYSIGNEEIGGKLKLVEKMNGRIFHESRGTLTKVAQSDKDTMAILAQAIWKWPNEKYISSFGKKDLSEIRTAKKAMSELNKEYRSLLAG